MRDKLESLIDTFLASVDIDKFYSQNQKEKLVKWLRENGVIVPYCKNGDKVYALFGHTILECEVATMTVEPFKEIGMSYACYGGFVFDNRHIEKTVFLTREAAEQALKGGVE